MFLKGVILLIIHKQVVINLLIWFLFNFIINFLLKISYTFKIVINNNNYMQHKTFSHINLTYIDHKHSSLTLFYVFIITFFLIIIGHTIYVML